MYVLLLDLYLGVEFMRNSEGGGKFLSQTAYIELKQILSKGIYFNRNGT